MEMVSASKMKRAQQMALASRPYTEKMYQVITSLAQAAKDQVDHFLLTDPRKSWDSDKEFNVLVILMATDKSLCGGLNTNLFRGLEAWLKEANQEYALPSRVKFSFVTVGKKAKEHILKTNRFLDAEFASFGDRPHFADIVPIGKLVMDNFKEESTQMAFMVYMEFVSTIAQKLSVKQLLPISATDLVEEAEALEPQGLSGSSYKGAYLFEPNPQQIFEDLLPQYVELQLYHVLLEALASEHSARMVAMKNANENALEIVDELTLEFNTARQAKITNELLDVVGARMALE
jgi:F-type H+-transporting ATPase subunit gamma